MSSRADRIKGAVVRGIVSGLTRKVVQSHISPVIQPERQVYTGPAARPIYPSNEIIQKAFRALNTLEYTDKLSPELVDRFRQDLQGNLIAPKDSYTLARTKAELVDNIVHQINEMVRGNRQRSEQMRPMPALSGRGAYTWRNFGRDASTGIGSALGAAGGALAGTALGGGIPNPGTIHGGYVGAALGGGIGQEVGNAIFGRGAYMVAKNSLYKSGAVLSEGTEVPSFVDNNRYTRIVHREFVQDIVVPASPTGFTNISFAINPGNSALFPWLSSIAACYQQYEIMGMVVQFKSTSTDFSTSGALGAVVLATNYDVLETPYANKVIMENSQYAVSAKPSLSQMHAIECDPKLTSITTKYIRNASSSTVVSQDARFYDHGSFQLATVGLSSSAGQVLGELWVTYDIKLLKPEIVNTAVLLAGQKITSGGTTTKTNMFGTTPTTTGSLFATFSNNIVTWQRIGQFLVVMENAGSVVTDPSETISGLTFNQISNIGNGSFNMYNSYLVNCTAAGQSITFDFSASTTISLTIMRIAAYSFSTG
jgi:hypothetical protein